jgi:low temperature requirement protein LtrA
MQSRWYHKPVLHTAYANYEKKAGWLELFYDLIFVAAFIQLGNGLSENIGLKGGLVFVSLFIPLWFAWTGFSFYSNRFNVDDFLHRVLVFVQMFSVGAMAVSVPKV